MGMFSKEEFIAAMVRLGCDSLDKLKERLSELPAELDSDVTFRKVYEFSFLFAREVCHEMIIPFAVQAIVDCRQERGLWRRIWQRRCGS